MSERNEREPNVSESDKPGQPTQPTVYASPVKRAWAWVGVVYMVIILLLFTYFLARGEFIRGIGGLMIVPALCGIAATALLQHKADPRRVPFMATLSTVCVSAALGIWGVLSGWMALMQNFGG